MASSDQPGGTGGPPLTPPYLALLRAGFTWHPTSPPNPVSSYLTLSPLPAVAGGLLSVALSLGLPPLDVIQRLALRSPDFPPPSYDGGDRLSYSSQSFKTVFFHAGHAILGLACAAYQQVRLRAIPHLPHPARKNPRFGKLTSLLLLKKQNSIAVRTRIKIVALKEGVVELRRQLHMAPLARTVPGLGQCLTTSLAAQLGITPHH